MNCTFASLFFLALGGVTVSALPVQSSKENLPPVFDKRSYAEAKQAAAEAKKWFIVKATAEWCGPCKQMDKTTWRDEKVAAWLAANAIAVQLDVDEEQDLAAKLNIEALPTVIALKEGGPEFDRIIGYKKSAEFLTWTEAIARGERVIDAIRKRAGDRGDDAGKVDIKARLDLARSLQQSGKADEAATEYVWLWSHMLAYDPSYVGVRLSFMASDMGRLVARSESAKQKFTALRDEAEKTIFEEKVAPADLGDWFVLNRILGDRNRTLTWFDGVKDSTHWKPVLELLVHHLEDLLIQGKRWGDLGKIYGDPAGVLERANDLRLMSSKHSPKGFDGEQKKTFEDMGRRMFRAKAGNVYAGLLAAGREEEARKITARARELDDSPEMVAALVSTALAASQPRKDQVEWLTEAIKRDGSLKKLLDRTNEALSQSENKLPR